MSDSNNSTKASLGCGSLILIAIIVLIFGNSGNDEELLKELRDTRSDIKELKAKVATQTAAISKLENIIKARSPGAPKPRVRYVPQSNTTPESDPE